MVDLVVYCVGEAFGLDWADGAEFFADWWGAFGWEEPVDGGAVAEGLGSEVFGEWWDVFEVGEVPCFFPVRHDCEMLFLVLLLLVV